MTIHNQTKRDMDRCKHNLRLEESCKRTPINYVFHPHTCGVWMEDGYMDGRWISLNKSEYFGSDWSGAK